MVMGVQNAEPAIGAPFAVLGGTFRAPVAGWPRVTARPTGSRTPPPGSPRRCCPTTYLHLANPLWSARELRGKIVSVTGGPRIQPPSIKPGWGFLLRLRRRPVRRYRGAGGRPLDVALVFADLGAGHLAG